jgi:hypothetical protein
MLSAAKKKKSKAGAAEGGDGSRSGRRSGSGSTSVSFCMVLLVATFFITGSLYFFHSRFGSSTSGNLKDKENLHLLLTKAQELAVHYRDLTGAFPTEHNEVIENVQKDLKLRRPDIAAVKAEGHSHPGPGLGSSPATIKELTVRAETSHRNRDPKRDVVIGIAHDMDPKNFVVFCASLREVNPKVELVIFSNSPIAAQNVKIAGDYDVTLLEYGMDRLEQYGGHSTMKSYHPSTLRWPFIAKYFEESVVRDQYARVWMADVRDTYFQSDPFSMLGPDEPGFLVFTGVDITLAQCGWNGNWVKDCFGDEMLSRIGKNKIICSGVSMGDMQSVYRYLQLMNDVVSGNKQYSIASSSRFPTCERNGVDQVYFDPNSWFM